MTGFSRDTIHLEHVLLTFKNFGGLPDRFNPDGGKRYFSIILTEEQGQALIDNGYNVKRKPGYDGGPDEITLQISISYKGRQGGPSVFLLSPSTKQRKSLVEDTLITADWVDVLYADIRINPYDHGKGGTGRAAYLKTLAIVIDEDPIELAYADYVEANADQTPQLEGGYTARLALGPGGEYDERGNPILDVELVD